MVILYNHSYNNNTFPDVLVYFYLPNHIYNATLEPSQKTGHILNKYKGKKKNKPNFQFVYL